MQEELMRLASELEMDFSFQLDNMYRRCAALSVLIWTPLIETEVIDELAIRCRCRRAGKGYHGTCHAGRNRLYGELP